MEKIYVDDRMIGYLIGNIFRSERSKEKHLFRKLNAWGLDSDVLDRLVTLDGEIRILDKDEGTIYTTTAKHFKEKGQYFHFKDEKKDHKTQLFLPLSEWKQEKYVKGT
jgi:hypothetical protein